MPDVGEYVDRRAPAYAGLRVDDLTGNPEVVETGQPARPSAAHFDHFWVWQDRGDYTELREPRVDLIARLMRSQYLWREPRI